MTAAAANLNSSSPRCVTLNAARPLRHCLSKAPLSLHGHAGVCSGVRVSQRWRERSSLWRREGMLMLVVFGMVTYQLVNTAILF